jgi:hypothetical protein
LAGEGLTLAGIRRLFLLEAEVRRLRAEVKRLTDEDQNKAAGTTGPEKSLR